jgi:hypothetical protein
MNVQPRPIPPSRPAIRHGKLVVLPPGNAEGCSWWLSNPVHLPSYTDKGRITTRLLDREVDSR